MTKLPGEGKVKKGNFDSNGARYGNTGCEVFKRGVQNWKDFCLRINILKGNYSILRIGLVGASEVFKNQSFNSQLFSSSQEKNTSN